MKLATAEEMRLLDQTAINEYGIPGVLLMENAGLAVVHAIKDYFSGPLARKRVMVIAGKGNNGGDGFVVARHLANAGCDVKLFLLCKPEELHGDAALNWKIARKMNIRYQLILTERDLNVVKVALMYTELVVDGIFGTGFQGAAQGTIAKLIELVNEAGKPVISIDLPSGMEADTGRVNGACIKARCTVTFGLPKIGLVLEPGASFVGKMLVADISLPQELVVKQPLRRFLLDQDFCRQLLPVRAIDSHKGSFGHVLVIGGAPGMTGAVTLAATAAVRSGAGLVTAAVPAGLSSVMAMKLTEAMSLSLPETGSGTLSLSALGVIEKAAGNKVIVLGPGLSRQQETQDLVRSFLANIPCPVVLDADGLFALSGCQDFIKNSSYPVVLTPHPGEMARLLGVSSGEIQANRREIVEKAAREWQAVLVLKGAKTVVATPEGNLYVNPTGNPGMATGGSGDVLAGMIGALLAQGMKAEHAAAVAVYLHGAAGDEGARRGSQASLTAGDIIDYLPLIFQRLEERL
ncbi:NAD(P)H-hydrate dehydratase [Candidatus Formimonas warabiya]|uniref:Bifunctional NAD(P)H-hydrate repair enzyme n=1 Tax=Formimonas warabiya TaxID=1761012 RepID=A0A3G1KT23_FORW1|nr:NAD(P)H-hydrate dehydratase [Candidatus Formimonas warabiya]ATW25577.1 bifunctional ADP-dependent (S)-NAD(P)H-hydrate dehydratase/NAD(P)H-hydrate epimerase [Candidatus Formimonas warabiya]